MSNYYVPPIFDDFLLNSKNLPHAIFYASSMLSDST